MAKFKKKLFENAVVKKEYSKFKERIFKSKLERKKKQMKKLKVEEEATSVPRSIVFHRDSVGSSLKALEDDFKRNIMMPYTATSVNVSRRVRLGELKDIGTELGVTHFVYFRLDEQYGPTMKITRLPIGPTLKFAIHEYASSYRLFKFAQSNAEILSPLISQPTVHLASVPPVVILNGFNQPQMEDLSEDDAKDADTATLTNTHLRLVATTFQNMFPPIDVQNFKLGKKGKRRVLLFNFNPDDHTIDMRQYYSEVSTNNKEIKSKKKLDLVEIGPRMKMSLFSVQDAFTKGNFLYHSKMNNEQIREINKKMQKIRKQKEERKKEQEENVKTKEDAKQKKKDEKRSKKDSMKQKATEKMKEIIEEE